MSENNMTAAPKFTLADAVCRICQHRIGWHGQRQCPGFEADNLAALYGDWIAENEPPSGFRNEADVPGFVLIARAALKKIAP